MGKKRVAKKAAPSRRVAAATSSTRRQRTASLPGLEDHAIKALDLIAADYADIRDARMDLLRQEVDLKARTLKLMKKHGKTRYKHNGIEISITPGEETIKVKVRKPGDDDEEADGDALSTDVQDPEAPANPLDDEGTDTVEDETLSNA